MEERRSLNEAEYSKQAKLVPEKIDYKSEMHTSELNPDNENLS